MTKANKAKTAKAIPHGAGAGAWSGRGGPKPAKKKPRKPRPLKMIDHESTIGGAWEDGKSIIESLAEEMRSWADNLEENFSGTQRYEIVSTTADTLEGIDVTVPDELEDGKKFFFKYRTVAVSPSKMRHRSRANQMADAVEIWQALVTYLDEIADSTGKYSPAEIEAASSMSSDVQNAIDEAEGCEFPGMYG